MADVELVKKMLRAVLQANGGGVTAQRLSSEYRELTGGEIPHRLLGQEDLHTFMTRISTLARTETNASGEVLYFASPEDDGSRVAKVTARQRSSKKTGRVNTQMRIKPAAPLHLSAKPQGSLRQPVQRGRGGSRSAGRARGGEDLRPARDTREETGTHSNKNPTQNMGSWRGNPAAERSEKRPTLSSRFQKEVHAHLSRNSQQSRSPLSPPETLSSGKGKPYNSAQIQRHISEILGKYSNGFWVSKLPQIYRELYNQDLPAEAIKNLEGWTHICTVEKTCSSNTSELLLYPAKGQRTTTVSTPTTPSSPARTPTTPSSPAPTPTTPSSPAPTPTTPSTPKDKPVPSSDQQGAINPNLTGSGAGSGAGPDAGSGSPQSSPGSPLSHSPPSSPSTLSHELKSKLEELLIKYCNGLWAHALPKLFQDTYKIKLPTHVLENLHLLSDICTVDYPMPENPKRAILYRKSKSAGGEEKKNSIRRNSAPSEEELRVRHEVGRRLSTQAVPALQIPPEEYPSVLVVEAASTNSVIIRYIGEAYSQAQETMEDEMRQFYGLNGSSLGPLSCPSSGQLVAVRSEEEEEILRGQVTSVMANQVKVYYVDHGFSEVTSKTKVFELHKKFFQLPFQATRCKLAGLEPFCQEAAVLQTFENMASGRILLVEVLERQQNPVVVLYDTSQEDDVNINAACMKALQDHTLSTPLKVNSVYMNVAVSSVCSDGSVYCQLPSRGLTKLQQILEKIDAYFHSQVTSEFLVSRPFCGKACLARYKGKWSRVEITNLHGSRVVDILFMDLGVQASVEVFELREIPDEFLRELLTIPTQAVRCCLADLAVSVGSWTHDAVSWLREKILHSSDCSMKVSKVDETKNCVYVHLFPDKNFQDPARSLNRQIVQSDLFRQQPDVFLTSHSAAKKATPRSSTPSASTNGSAAWSSGSSRPDLRMVQSGARGGGDKNPSTETRSPPPSSLQLPPLLELPPPGNNLDVYVSVACHPGHFVLQPWRDMYKLVVLMGEMILYYNQTEEKPLSVEKNHIYAAKVENSWHRVLVKGVLSNGLVSVYELDYGKHELVGRSALRPLIQEFTQLPVQGITAQLAGMKPRSWSEESSIVFRNHVEKKPLVAQLESIQEAQNPWDRRLTVYLVDTSQEEKDMWVHDIMAEFAEDLDSL